MFGFDCVICTWTNLIILKYLECNYEANSMVSSFFTEFKYFASLNDLLGIRFDKRSYWTASKWHCVCGVAGQSVIMITGGGNLAALQRDFVSVMVNTGTFSWWSDSSRHRLQSDLTATAATLTFTFTRSTEHNDYPCL